MISSVVSFGILGIDGFEVRVEVNLSPGMPAFDIVGLPDASVKESRERVRTAIRNSGYEFPVDRVTVNLAPADVRKEGPAFDLAIALGIIACCNGFSPTALEGTAVLGELSLYGSVSPVRGALPMVVSAMEAGVKRIMLPAGNLSETCCVDGIELIPVETLRQAVEHFSGANPLRPAQCVSFESLLKGRQYAVDFCHVKGQKGAKRALEIAAAGGHNVLLIGPPGSGKTLMARCLPTILPDMSFEEALETTRIHSVSGLVSEAGLITERPFRSPHHTASHASLVGGGANALPGEVSKAHNGVLFLDELPEYRRDVLEALRQPLEDRVVTVSRVNAQATYPANFVLVCSMNPCPCGNLGSRRGQCRCTPGEIRRYLSRISGPLLDRIDMHVGVESIPSEQLSGSAPEETSAEIRARVEAARRIQEQRYRELCPDIRTNAQLGAGTLNKACQMSAEARELLNFACEKLNFSNRAYTRIIKVARTIADLAGDDAIDSEHVAEAVNYRSLDGKYWD